MTLSSKAQQSIDFSHACFLQGICKADEYLRAVKEIYQEDIEKQTKMLMEYGFTRKGAIRNIYNLDKGGELL